MSILFIESWLYNEEQGRMIVRAMVEDAIVVHQASWEQPEELGEALCSARVLVEPGEWPDDELQRIDWLEDYQPEWTPVDEGGW